MAHIDKRQALTANRISACDGIVVSVIGTRRCRRKQHVFYMYGLVLHTGSVDRKIRNAQWMNGRDLTMRRVYLITAAVVITAGLGLAGAARATPAHASESVVWGPGCSNDNTPFSQAPIELDYNPTGGSWTHYSGLDSSGNKPDFSGSGTLGGCAGSIEYAWNGTSENFQWLIPNFQAYLPWGASCTIDAYIPTIYAGVYAARYDFWWADTSGNWHWLAWPGYDVDQEALSGWNQIMYPFTMPQATEFKITLHDDTANDSSWRYMGAGDMRLNCG